MYYASYKREILLFQKWKLAKPKKQKKKKFEMRSKSNNLM